MTTSGFTLIFSRGPTRVATVLPASWAGKEETIFEPASFVSTLFSFEKYRFPEDMFSGNSLRPRPADPPLHEWRSGPARVVSPRSLAAWTISQ